jgi:hypothetical protein
MSVPAGLIFIWNSTNATIPANWERETKLDAQFIKGTADTVDPDVTGGAATHTHTSAAHTHVDAHTHTITINACTQGGIDTGNGSSYSRVNHTHTASCGTISGGGLSSVTSTYSAISNNPPYYQVIFIKPVDGAQTGIPNNACALIDNPSIPTGWTEVTDCRDKFLRGAATDGNSGGIGGSVTNVHDLTHTHVVAAHDHANTTSGTPSSTGGASGSDGNACSSAGHTHTIDVAAQTSTISGTPSLTTTETVEPVYKTLIIIQNGTGANNLPIGIVGMWLGILADIPTGWSEVTGMRGKYLKGSSAPTTVGETGGANTHTHASQAHIHTASAVHTHTHANLTHTKAGEDTGGSGFLPSSARDGVHTVTVANSTSTYENGSTTADSSSNEPVYTTVAFIKLDRYNFSGSFIYAML